MNIFWSYKIYDCQIFFFIVLWFYKLLQFWEEDPEIYGVRRSGRQRKEPERFNVMLEVLFMLDDSVRKNKGNKWTKGKAVRDT